ncbi:MAG: ABC transporter substrate-binding protein [Shinella zoogloeoides]|uniref:ABC transporter substrate-binding protein n=1 Tax=Shinella zoogloeoides TaxID=352475 RepID=UPI003C732DF4
MSDSRNTVSCTRRALLGGVALALAAGVVAGLPGIPRALAAEELRIGMAHSHTGWAASFDSAFAAGFSFAAQEINEKGGIDGKLPVKLVQGRDAASSSAEAVKSVEGLLKENVSVLMTSADSSGTIAAGRIGQTQGVLMFGSTCSPPSVTSQVGDWMYLSNFSDNLMGTVLALYARELGIESVYLLKSPDDAYTEKLPDYFADVFQKKGGTIVGEGEYNFNQVDFGSVVADIRALPEPPDAIMTAAFEPDFPALLRQLRAAGIKSRILGADAIDTPTIFSLGPIADGTVVLSNRQPLEGSTYKEIEGRFAKVYPEHAENAAWIVGYTAMEVIADVARRAGATDPAALRKALEETEGFAGPGGPITYAGRNRLPVWPVHVLEIEGGEGVYKKTIVPDAADIPAP